MKATAVLSSIMTGYAGFLRSAFALLLALAAAGGASALLAWPLWIAATSHPRLYALSLGAALAALAMVLGYRSSSRRVHADARARAPRRLARRLLLLALALAALPAFALALRAPLIGLPLLVLIALLAGFPLFVGRRA